MAPELLGQIIFLTTTLDFMLVNDWLEQVCKVREMLTRGVSSEEGIDFSLRTGWKTITTRAKQQAECLQLGIVVKGQTTRCGADYGESCGVPTQRKSIQVCQACQCVMVGEVGRGGMCESVLLGRREGG